MDTAAPLAGDGLLNRLKLARIRDLDELESGDYWPRLQPYSLEKSCLLNPGYVLKETNSCRCCSLPQLPRVPVWFRSKTCLLTPSSASACASLYRGLMTSATAKQLLTGTAATNASADVLLCWCQCEQPSPIPTQL